MPQSEYVVKLKATDADTLLPLRGTPDVFVQTSNEDIWVLARKAESEPPHYLASLPGISYQLNEDNGLTPIGNLLVTERLPDTNWVGLNTWLDVELPTASWPGRSEHRIHLTLVPSEHVISSSAVLTSIEELEKFVDGTTQFRFQHLSFAMNAAGQVLVTGSPLPPLPGDRFYLNNQIAVPAGFAWCPAVDAETIREVFGNPVGLIIWLNSDSWELIADQSFTAVTREAVRSSAANARSNQQL